MPTRRNLIAVLSGRQPIAPTRRKNHALESTDTHLPQSLIRAARRAREPTNSERARQGGASRLADATEREGEHAKAKYRLATRDRALFWGCSTRVCSIVPRRAILSSNGVGGHGFPQARSDHRQCRTERESPIDPAAHPTSRRLLQDVVSDDADQHQAENDRERDTAARQ